ncbi:MAG TPA: AAA family ATPase, partial [Holosporales bacterium]|nr:AAA family ATPase [Holosporales bacterium]
MVAIVKTVVFQGIEALPIEVQVQIASGLPSFAIVGLPDKAVGESRERVRAALSSIGLALPPKKITINLSPADLQKEGSHFDLPIALGLLVALEALKAEDIQNYIALGELSLDARLTSVSGALPSALMAASLDKGIICPAQNGAEAAWAQDIQVIAAPDLVSLINHLKGKQVLTPPAPCVAASNHNIPDMSDIKGQESAKRALEIAAAGGHNLLLQGPPGAGKSMLAARLPGLLPPLSPQEALEVTMVHSIAGQLNQGQLLQERPFRDPHHSASLPALVGGGAKAKPGEISLAHHGVLFLDELPEFSGATLETLRQPLETGRIMISRASAHVS